MLKSRGVLLVLAGLATGILAACDTQEGPDTQASEQAAAEALTGSIDASLAGDSMPQVTVTAPDGTTLDLADTRGMPVLLNLWATWCAPCIVEMPMLDELAGEVAGQVRVITVSEDLRGAEVVVPFFEERDFQHLPQWIDAQNELAFAFGGGAVLPLTVLYDAQGREVWRVVGAYDWSTAEARERVLEATAG